jgi:Schlafen group 3, DNA/RNA helicase domain
MEQPYSSVTVIGALSRAWYEASIEDFLSTDPDSVIGQLAKNCDFALLVSQKEAWLAQIAILKKELTGISGSLFLEFNIPRMGRRIDTVLVVGPVLFVIEFKVGESGFDRASRDQVWDYALDLKNFHEASHRLSIVPILIATKAKKSASLDLQADDDRVYRPLQVSLADFRELIDRTLTLVTGQSIDTQRWSSAPYRPTPTIVEAARSLYAQHSVEAIARHDAGAQNLHTTSKQIEKLIDDARAHNRKVICFVTGVPGAGKTLVGLNVATRRGDATEPTHAVFLSGNGPLVAVLREALTRDEVARQKSNGQRARKGKVAESVKTFIQNVHHFRDDALVDLRPPAEHVAIFDEAQRAWNLRQTANFMRRKKNHEGFSQSEPEFLISYMNRHPDWAVIVCLVGGGQEINIGEAGIDAWIEAINERFPKWHMHISSNLTDAEYASGNALHSVRDRPNTHLDSHLHLSVSMRSFRSEDVSAFVKALLDCEKGKAHEYLARLSSRYPITLTRDLNLAKDWIRKHARGSERYGLLASSKAQRLKPHAIDIRVNVNPIHWFLNEKDDTRSSYYLEDAATEFQVQGLELDWACVTWDGDLRFSEAAWTFHDFRGAKWINIANLDNQRYLRNAYRVLLTRARQGMVIFVPPGDPADHTRTQKYYDSTYNYLAEIGIPILT